MDQERSSEPALWSRRSHPVGEAEDTPGSCLMARSTLGQGQAVVLHQRFLCTKGAGTVDLCQGNVQPGGHQASQQPALQDC